MGKGWGLTLENNSDRQVVLFGQQKTVSGFNLSPRFNSNPIMFPINSNDREENVDAVSSREVDFFSDKRRLNSNNNNNEIDVTMKKEFSCNESLDVNTGLQLVTANTGSDQSAVDDTFSCDDLRSKNELAQIQFELERMNAENQRLKGMLTQVNNNYSALQMHLVTLMQQQQISRNDTIQDHEITNGKSEEKKQENGDQLIVPRQFLDLVPKQSNSTSEEKTHSGSPHNTIEVSRNKRVGREETPESEGWGPNKAPKISPPKPIEQSNDATMRKVRVSVRARSEAPMISDGCQWRKYGQKMAKGNPCPRAYYRCTMAVGCPVRKQVQRCAEDRAILITTYEGTHNHPLPHAAMAMVSTTSAAANMLLSGSMPSADGMMNPNFLSRTILPCSSNMATISASAPFPTVTLDLTQNPNPLQFQRPNAPFQVPFHIPPQHLNQGLYNQSKFSGLQMSHDMNEAAQLSQQQQVPQNHPSYADTLSAATAAITSDPNFTAALAAAISSIMGGSTPNNNGNNSSPNNANANVNTTNINRTSSFQGNES